MDAPRALQKGCFMSFLVILWMVILGIALLVYLGLPIFSKTGAQLAATSDDVIQLNPNRNGSKE